MLVLIPDNNDTIKLKTIQKEMIKTLNDDDRIFLESYPLWIDISGIETSELPSKKILKDIAGKIKSVTINTPALENDDYSCTVTILMDDKIKTKNIEIKAKLTFLKSYKNKSGKKNPPEKDDLWSSKFPMELKVFRLGFALNQKIGDKGNIYSLKDFVWIKL